MEDQISDSHLAENLKQGLVEQEDLMKRFKVASPAEDYKDDIELGEPYRLVTEFRMDPTAFLVKHTPTEQLNQWSVMTGPKRLKTSVEGWVDKINGEKLNQ